MTEASSQTIPLSLLCILVMPQVLSHIAIVLHIVLHVKLIRPQQGRGIVCELFLVTEQERGGRRGGEGEREGRGRGIGFCGSSVK